MRTRTWSGGARSPGGARSRGGARREGVIAARVIVAIVAIVAGAGEGRAQVRLRPQRDYRLELHGLDDASCPSEAAFRADVSRVCGIQEDAFDPNGRHVIRVVVRKGRLYKASVALFLPDGTADASKQKAYEATTCGQVMREAAVAASAIIPLESVNAAAAPACDEECIGKRVEEARREGYEKGRLDGRKEREGEIGEQIREEVARQLRAFVLPPRPPPDNPPLMTFPYAVSVGAVLSIGYGLDVAPGVVIGAEWRPIEYLSVGVDLRGILPSKVSEVGTIDPKPNLNATMLSALVAPCARWKILMGCAVLDAGGIYFNTEPVQWWPRFAVGPRVGVDVPFAERFSVRVMGDLLFPLVQTSFAKQEGAFEFGDPLVSGFVTAGLAVSF